MINLDKRPPMQAAVELGDYRPLHTASQVDGGWRNTTTRNRVRVAGWSLWRNVQGLPGRDVDRAARALRLVQGVMSK